jgi:hypothetical protein
MFFVYGLRSASPPALVPKQIGTDSKPRASHRGRYRPPHLRNKAGRENNSLEGPSSDSEYSRYDLSSSDSDLSDSDGYAKNGDRFRSSKARIAAILCIQVCSYTVFSLCKSHIFLLNFDTSILMLFPRHLYSLDNSIVYSGIKICN